MTNLNLYGTIGYTILQNSKQKIMIFADKHDKLPYCTNKTDIADWFKEKMHSSKILLEEVPRDSVNLEELWTDSEHTQDLKKLFLDNPEKINGLDIRPLLIPWSWELANGNESEYKISMGKYLKKLNLFFCLKNAYLVNKMPNYSVGKLRGSKLGNHFLQIKKLLKKYWKQIVDFYPLAL